MKASDVLHLNRIFILIKKGFTGNDTINRWNNILDSTYFQHKKIHVSTLWKVMRIYFLDFHKYVLSISLFFPI